MWQEQQAKKRIDKKENEREREKDDQKSFFSVSRWEKFITTNHSLFLRHQTKRKQREEEKEKRR